MQDGLFPPVYCFFSLAIGKRKMKACNLQLADAEQINFRCLPRLLQEFCPPSLSPPPGRIMAGISRVPGGSTEAAVPSLLRAGLPGRAAIPSHAGSSVSPHDNQPLSQLSHHGQTLPGTTQSLVPKPILAGASLEGLDEHEGTNFPHLLRYWSFQC